MRSRGEDLVADHDPDNWPLIREALKEMKLGALIGSGADKLVPLLQPRNDKHRGSARRKNKLAEHKKRIRKGKALSQHTGLPPRSSE